MNAVTPGGSAATERSAMSRMLDPQSIAIVGVSETSPWASGALATLASGVDVSFIHPKYTRLFGQAAYPDIGSVGRPVDCIFSATSAERVPDLVEEGGAHGCGALITIAGGFAELGAHGAELQRRVRASADRYGMSMVGPNGIGMINVPRGLELTMLPTIERRSGSVSVVAHSGAIIACMIAATRRAGDIGLNLLISAGNEAVTDMAAYLDYLVDDPGTRIIVLGIETIRRPDAFFAAARRAREAGKPVVVLKLGRSERGMRIAQSHTGTLAADAWVYDIAFRQANIQTARDVDELVDRIQLLEQLPRSKWSAVRGLAVLTLTGGFASMATDIASDEGVCVPEATHMLEDIAAIVPGATVTNPLDATGFAGGRPEIWQAVIDRYASDDAFDSFLFMNQLADWDQDASKLVDPFAAMARHNTSPCILSPLAANAGDWIKPYRDEGIAIGNGIGATFRGLQTMGRFMRSRASSFVHDPAEAPAIAIPAATPIRTKDGHILPFAATMALLTAAGVPVAPCALIGEDEPSSLPTFPGPYVVKLADVPHRTEFGAVRLSVTEDMLAPRVEEMRALAKTLGVPATVAVQPMVDIEGEAFIGAKSDTELGPVVLFGLGGIFVELLKAPAGRLAPFSREDAMDMLTEIDGAPVLDGFRGGPAWNREQLATILEAFSRLIAGGRDWIESIDINPIIFTSAGFVAVDGLVVIKSD